MKGRGSSRRDIIVCGVFGAKSSRKSLAPILVRGLDLLVQCLTESQLLMESLLEAVE